MSTLLAIGAAFAQQEELVSTQDQITIFVGFTIAVIAVFIFLARDMILRRKTEYDEKDLGSKKDREYEKYHSDWTDDYEDVGSRSKKDKQYRDLPDLYQTLGINKDATPQEIKNQYRVLAKQIHPDKSKEQDAKEKMAQINQAYEILSDPKQRAEYDRQLDETNNN